MNVELCSAYEAVVVCGKVGPSRQPAPAESSAVVGASHAFAKRASQVGRFLSDSSDRPATVRQVTMTF